MIALALDQHRLRQFLSLTKPRVVSLIVFTAVIGMFLAVPGLPPLKPMLFGTLGIALVAAAAAVINCLVEQKIDAKMARTRARPLPRGELTTQQALMFASVIGGVGLGLLYAQVNALTMWLTLATFVGYAVVYTVLLKPATPQNIVIGGASGAMPPILGWAAISDDVAPQALILFLIIFVWTPPHFWALALYRAKEYANAGLPMLPVTHGPAYTRLQIVLYTIALFAVSLLPFAIRMSGWIYLVTAVILGGVFIGYAVIYTVLLKPATPQNIVIGGASGAMPPVLGWAAIADDVAPQALILFLIIFVWTPPHFWALALYRAKEYANAGLPMLPVTHGPAYTRLQILLYTIALFAVSLLPFAIRMSGWIYLVAAVVLGGVFIGYAVALRRRYSDRLSRQTFRYSIAYLAGLFSALLLDHYWK